MSWSVSASGSKDTVRGMIDRQVHSSHAPVKDALKTLVDDMAGDHVTVTGSGYGRSMTLSISSWSELAQAVNL